MKSKMMIVLLGGITGFLSVGVTQADSAYERALGVGVNQGYQGASRSGNEIYPGVWSKGRSNKTVDREEIYPGVWSESSIPNQDQGVINQPSNSQLGYSIVNRSTSNNKTKGSFNERANNQNIDAQIQAREEASREEYRINSRANSSGSFSGRSSVNTPVQTVPGVTVRDREHTNVAVEDLINPEFD